MRPTHALENKGIELITIKDLEVNLPINENGKNAIENAYIKAKIYDDNYANIYNEKTNKIYDCKKVN